MDVLDLFSGIGGFSLAFERAGFRTVAFSEIEPYPCKVLAKHWPTVPNLGDVTAIRGADIEADIVTGGFPCQDLSVAGKRAGLVGERSGLYWQIIRIVREMQEAGHGPAIVVLENVAGLLSSNGGRDFASVLSGLAELGADDIAWRILDAQHFGVPQRRRRVFIVADFAGERAEQILFEPESVRGDTAPSREAGEDIAGTLSEGAGSRGACPDDAGCLVAQSFAENQRGEVITSDTAGSLKVGGGKLGQGYPAIAFCGDTTPKWSRDVAGSMRRDQGGEGYGVMTPAMQVRRLTPTECERLQGYPDGFTEGGADGPRYRALGNSVAVPVVEWIAHRLRSCIETKGDGYGNCML